MNRKIIMSAGIIVFGVALVLGSTGAFFGDKEKSTGNTFTAGAVDLKVDSVQHYNGKICVLDGASYVWAPMANITLDSNNQPVLGVHDFAAYNLANPTAYPTAGSSCNGTWTLTDLANGVQKFWDFSDVKPGDQGENTISLHLDNNPAWACVDFTITKNDDNTCTEPETEAEGAGVCNNSSPFTDLDGELATNLQFAAWSDDGDNVWESGEALLFNGPASTALGTTPITAAGFTTKTYPLADSTTVGGPLPTGATRYVGIAWCAGTQTVNTTAFTITCSGSGLGNSAQTDSLVADVAFRVEQARNNATFKCIP